METNPIYRNVTATAPNPATRRAAEKLNELSKTLKHSVAEKKESVYISGKITGEDLPTCIEKFKKAEDYLRALLPFAKIINPLDLAVKEFGIDTSEKWEVLMRFSLKHMLDCGAIFMLTDWINSEGATIELKLAKKLNFDILYQ